MSILEVLKQAKETGASDILISVGVPPILRVGGKLVPCKGMQRLSAESSSALLKSILREDQKEKLASDLEIDFSVSIKELGRYRVNVYTQRGTLAAAFRVINSVIPELKTLDVPPAVHDLVKLPRGLVLITGPTGSGKSTLMASMINQINTDRSCHIITLEDPIEYLHKHANSIVDQREINSDTQSFEKALKSALRQDPDVILLGEMRDPESISTALTIAETGHLVFSSLHTQDAAQTIDRIIDVFPSGQQPQIRNQVATSLKAVISQQLVMKKEGGLTAAREVMLMNSAVSNLVRENKIYQIPTVMQTSLKDGMITMEHSLVELFKSGVISEDTAIMKSSHPAQIRKALGMMPEEK